MNAHPPADPAADPQVELSALDPVHLIGVGGAGMSGVARLLAAAGLRVSGSDQQDSSALRGLAEAGVRVSVGHRAEQVPTGATVVISTAVRDDNPELVHARAVGLRVLHRSEALAAVMADRQAVAVAGTHGKTTTTGMLVTTAQQLGWDPGFALGGELLAPAADGQAAAAAGSGTVFVAEADESDASFLRYRPWIAVITNVEADHLDHYGTAESVLAAFVAFCLRVRSGGAVVACGDDPGVQQVLAQVQDRLAERGVRIVRYGRSDQAQVQLRDLTSTSRDGQVGQAWRVVGDLGSAAMTLPSSGVHNALNATAAWAVCVLLGAQPAAAASAVAAFAGTKRRFELRGAAAGVRVVDDYAHHPTEVAALLTAARAVVGTGRVVVVFQPHLFSRTAAFAAEFAQALAAADEVLVLPIYAAREDPDPTVSAALITGATVLAGRARAVSGPDEAVDCVAALARAGDLVLTVGAGDVTALGPRLLQRLAPAATADA